VWELYLAAPFVGRSFFFYKWFPARTYAALTKIR
jgi:hypothetical protein